MGKIGNMATGGAIEWPLGPSSTALPTGDIRISNRES
jgi:hypothetical protein